MGITELPPNHKRIISVTAKTIEEELNEMETVLSHDRSAGYIKKIILSYSDEERKELIEKIGELRKLNHIMSDALNLNSTEITEEQIIKGKLSYLWTVLIDSKSRALKGYGTLPEETAAVLDKHIDNLLELVEKTA